MRAADQEALQRHTNGRETPLLAPVTVSITEKMQCVKLLKKRSLDLEPWNCYKTKRVCLGAGLQDDCPMETCDSLNLSNQPLLQLQPQLQPQPQLQLQPLVQPQLQPLVQSQLQFQPQFQLQPLVQPELQPLVQLQQNKQLFPLKPDPGSAPVCVRCLRGEPGHINHILGL